MLQNHRRVIIVRSGLKRAVVNQLLDSRLTCLVAGDYGSPIDLLPWAGHSIALILIINRLEFRIVGYCCLSRGFVFGDDGASQASKR